MTLYAPNGAVLGFMVQRPGQVPVGPFDTYEEAVTQAGHDRQQRYK